MPLVSMISDALLRTKGSIPMVSAVHLSEATMEEAKTAVLIFASPECLLRGCGRMLLQDSAVAPHLQAVFIDEFHIISAW